MFNDAGGIIGSNAIDAAVTHFQLHSSNTGPTWATNAVGTRVAVNGTVDGDGDITWSNTAFTGLAANQAVGGVSYWSASTAGTCYGGSTMTGDATANAAGEYTVTSVVETSTMT